MMVRMITHSKTIHLTIQMAALRNGFVPDKRKRLDGSSCRSASVSWRFRAILREINYDVIKL